MKYNNSFSSASFFSALSGLCLLPALLWLLAGTTGCGLKPEQTSVKEPFSVIVDSYESLEEATHSARRLQKMGKNAYVIKKMAGNGNFSMNVHIGAFKSEQEALDLEQELRDIGLSQVQSVDYNQIIDDVRQFDKLDKQEQQEFVIKEVDIPDLSEAVLENITYFPVDENFRIINLRIENCMYNLRQAAQTDAFEWLPQILPEEISMAMITQAASAASQAIYEDKLFGYHIGITIAAVTDAKLMYNDIITGLTPAWGELSEKNLQYESQQGNFTGVLYELTESGYNRTKAENDAVTDPEASVAEPAVSTITYLAFLEDADQLLLIRSQDCPVDNFKALISGGSRQGLLVFPEVRKNLFVLPRTGDNTLTFSCYSLNRLGPKFAEARNNSEWARNIVGNYLATGYYLGDQEVYMTSFFNLNYVKSASAVHKIFIAEKSAQGNGEPLAVRDCDGWYLDNIGFTELSFSYGSYVIALNCYINYDWRNRSYEEMRDIHEASQDRVKKQLLVNASQLQIWDDAPAETFGDQDKAL